MSATRPLVSTPARVALVVLSALIVVAAVAGCSDKNKVGQGINTDNRQKAGDGFDASTTTTAPGTTKATTATTAPAAVVTTAAAVKATTTTKAPVTTTIPTVQAQVNASSFEPQNLRVFVNQSFTYTNADSSPRGIRAKGGQFKSPDLAPGATWTYAIPTAGTYEIEDSTRPFVVGNIVVVAR